MNPRVKDVRANDDYTLRLKFANGETRIYDMKPHLDFGVFRELKDLAYFKSARAALGRVCWPHEQDICPDTLYEASVSDSEEVFRSNDQPSTPARHHP